ncbi:hypothetical protein VTN96DRAFT_8281 [Rasamsonia emersonii]
MVVHDGAGRGTTVTDSPGTMTPPSSAVPSLSDGSSSPSSSSIATKMAAGIEGTNVLENDGTGNLVAPERPPTQAIYHCLFHILPCDYKADRVDEWKTHVLSHFRGSPLPSTARCQWCSANFTQVQPGSAWDAMLEHVAHDHFERGDTLASSQIDFELMRYLYCSKVITADQFKAVQLPPSPSSPAYRQSQDSVRARIGSSDEPFCSSYSPRREKRMRQQRRGISVA